MAKVTLRTFLKADKYKELIEKYNDVLHTEKQIIYIFNDNNFRFMKTKRYCSLDSGENYVKIENKYSKSMENILNSVQMVNINILIQMVLLQLTLEIYIQLI